MVSCKVGGKQLKVLKVTTIILIISLTTTILVFFISGYAKDYFRNKAGECPNEVAKGMINNMRFCEKIGNISVTLFYITTITLFVLLIVSIMIKKFNKI